MIGVFDSGIGGLTVFKELKKQLPSEPILYFGDTARVPWGNKSKLTVARYCTEICDFLISKKAKKIVIACNTASALAGEYLVKRYPQVKFYNVIDPCIETVSSGAWRKIGVIGTRATINSGVYQRKMAVLNNRIKIIPVECPLFVPLAEEGWTGHRVTHEIAQEYLAPLKKQRIEALILGCTHYPLLRSAIAGVVGPKVKIISSAQEVAREMARDGTNSGRSKGQDKFYFSDWDSHFGVIAKNIFLKKLKVNKIILPIKRTNGALKF